MGNQLQRSKHHGDQSIMEIEAQNRKRGSRRALSDLTNTDTTHISSHSSSSSPSATASAVKPFKAQLSSASNKRLNVELKSRETAGSVINRTASVNPSSAPPSLDSTPSRPPPRSLDSTPSRPPPRSLDSTPSRPPPPSLDSTPSRPPLRSLDSTPSRPPPPSLDSTPSRPPPPSLDSTPSRPPPPTSSWVSGSQHGGVCEPCSVYSRRKTSDRSKNKRKAVAEPRILITASGDTSDDIEDTILDWTLESLPEKKQRPMPHEDDASEDVLPQDYIEKQRAYFDEIDLEPLSVEEIASDAELD